MACEPLPETECRKGFRGHSLRRIEDRKPWMLPNGPKCPPASRPPPMVPIRPESYYFLPALSSVPTISMILVAPSLDQHGHPGPGAALFGNRRPVPGNDHTAETNGP